jgi:hypothetical protein
MPRENSKTISRLPVPDADSLVVRTTQNPRQIVRMELDCTHIIQMPAQRIENMLEIPHTDLVVIATTRKHAPRRVEVNGSDGPIVFLKPVQQCPDSVVP